MTTSVQFKALEASDGTRDGEAGWQVFVDGKMVIDKVRPNDMDVSWVGFDALWEAIGTEVNFDYD